MKYKFDVHNCQVFARLLVELIGDPATKADFPQFFDTWLKITGITRDVSLMTVAAGGATLAGAVVSVAVDPTMVTAAAGLGLGSSMIFSAGTALITHRYLREKDVEKGQKEIRKELELEGIRLE